jgi:hypothetical protein
LGVVGLGVVGLGVVGLGGPGIAASDSRTSGVRELGELFGFSGLGLLPPVEVVCFEPGAPATAPAMGATDEVCFAEEPPSIEPALPEKDPEEPPAD